METNSIKVLAIDDNFDNLISLKAVLSELIPDIRIFTALEGKKGIEIAIENNPDVILLDIIMPDFDGFDVCKSIKSNPKLKNIPVLFLTALKSDKLNRTKALEVGAEGFLTKPIEETDLIAQIKTMYKIKQANTNKETEKERLEALVNAQTKELRDANAAIIESERKFRELIETTTDIHYRQDIETGKIEYISPSVKQLFGYNIEEFLNLQIENHSKLYPPGEYISFHHFKIEIIRVLERGKTQIEDEFRIICKNGEIKWVNANYFITCNQNNKPQYINAVLRDITEKKRRENEIIFNNLRLKGIINILQSKSSTVQEFLDLALNEALKLTESKLGYIYWYNSKKKEFILNSWSKDVMNECAVMNPQTCYELGKTGIWGEAVRQRKPIILNDFGSFNPLKKGFPKGHVELKSFMTIPIFQLDEIVGVVGVANKEKDYSETDVLQLTLLMNSVWNEAERKNAEEKYERLFTEMFDGFALHEIILDENGNAVNYKFLDVNPAFEKLTGLKRNEIVGKTVLDVLPNTEKYWIENYGEVAKTGVPKLFENFSVELKKYYEVRAFQPLKNQFACIITDISFRKKSEITNKVQYAIATAMVTNRSIQELYVTVRKELSAVMDTSNFIIAIYNKETEMLSTPYEIDENEVIMPEWSANKSLTGMIVKGRKSLLLQKEEISKLAEDGKINLIGSRAECWLGVPMMIDDIVFGAIIIQSYNNPTAYNADNMNVLEVVAHELSIFIDRKNTENQLILAKERAEESDRLKTAFLQNMSHEIRTPLNGILGFASLLDDDDIDIIDVKKYSSYIQGSGNRLFELINNVIDISKIESGSVIVSENEFSVNALIDEIYNQFSIMVQSRNLNLVKNIDNQNDIILISDSLKLHQILSNLVNNAIKFTTAGSVEISYKTNEHEIVFCVKDTGNGIDKEHIQKIFDRFYQADMSMERGFEGAGLGLSICKGLAKYLNGDIWVDSEINKGSSFYLKIPLKIGNQCITEYKQEKTHKVMNNNTILIAEDDDTSFSLLEMILKKENLQIIRASNGSEAVDIFKINHNIKCVLMDIKMPVMNGIEATKLIKSINPDIPVIAQTAYAFNIERQQVLAAGCNDYITKPISKKLLLLLLEKHLKNVS